MPNAFIGVYSRSNLFGQFVDMKVKSDPAVNFPMQLERRSLKKSGLQRDSNPVEALIFSGFFLRDLGCLSCSSFQLLKLENSLR